MSKVRESIGIDIGTSAIKLVHLNLVANKVQLIAYKIILLDKEKEGLVKEGQPLELNENIVTQIREFFSRCVDKKKVAVVTAVNGYQIFVRVFKLPAVGKSKLQKIIKYEAQQQVPFPITEVVWSYQLLRKVSSEEADVVLVAVKKDVINDFIDSFKDLNIRHKDLIVPVVSLYNVVDYKGSQPNQAVMILDMGAKTTGIIIIEKQNAWFRTVSHGGELITQAISEEFNISLKEAEELKKERAHVLMDANVDQAIVDPQAKKLSACVVRALTRLLGEISRSLEVYSSSFNSLGIRKIYLTGGASALKKMDQFLIKKFRVDVEDLDCVNKFDLAALTNNDKLTAEKRYLGVAGGAALQGLDLATLKLSLLPKKVVKEQLWSRRQAYLLIAAVMLVFLSCSYSFYNTRLKSIFKAHINQLNTESKKISSNIEEIDKVQQKIISLKTKVDRVDSLVQKRTSWSEMLLALEELIPKDSWLVEIRPGSLGDDGSIGLKLAGKTLGTYRDVVEFRDALKSSSKFISGSSKVVSASPPVNGVRDFVIQTRFKSVNEN